ncbi:MULTISPECIES: EpsG family protein [unclassified Photobacterium]|uniref:EpsG family protein n=1 Tax=unclassified Photobacterium TaxID=2628852 RepID=UPI001EDD83D3|nr:MULTISPECIES: EpsG family protein [unclassified Photobacterium]MCG3864915.1 EpsG family protein [Photobacterium sp. Ph6]MCG3876323.1 EpsG family protein [Photobacterium sp. Ph5]
MIEVNIFTYYIICLVIFFIAIFNTRLGLILLFLNVPIVLYCIQSNGADYEHYKADYETARQIATYPYFYTFSSLTAEPFYKIYSAFIKVITDINYSGFLAVNFIFCFSIYYIFTPFNKKSCIINHLFWLMTLPVIIPTIFYASPRSSLSYILILAGFFCLLRDKKIFSGILFFAGGMLHSQYLAISFILFFAGYFNLGAIPYVKNRFILFYILVSLSFVVVLKSISIILPNISSLLSFLPSAEVATGKLHYLTSNNTGFRLTSILSIIIFPIFSLLLYKRYIKLSEVFNIDINIAWRLCFLFLLITAFGLAINVAFFSNPHLSGRLSRFSDYTSLALLIPLVLICYFNRIKAVMILSIFLLLAPLLYPTVYPI